MERELADITQRLQPIWPEVDVGAVVASTYRQFAENARVTMYLPILTEQLARARLDDERRRRAATAPTVVRRP